LQLNFFIALHLTMEGFLNKKGRGESTFGRRNWKKRWFVLDGQYLTYYDSFDTKTGKPTAKKVSEMLIF
jgi:hypothetical protein